jgi:methylated-DNA-protein-cysteine methyltransferase related protein
MIHSELYQKIYEIVADIPEGKVATYGQIAWMAGRPGAPRIVGYAMRMVPFELKLPCHRVVNKAGKMAPDHVFGGEQLQRTILEQEGVTFLSNGCIDMKKCQWMMYDPDEDVGNPI